MDNNQKFQFKVMETMEWRNKEYQPGEVIEDTHNSYMKAMVHQGKLELVE